ncbi:MAG: Na+/H+ antiporter subunit E [Spirochaetales bacterium]|nr:Na+/H+ antiporter subunit E [Spirochaetales bacterium]
MKDQSESDSGMRKHPIKPITLWNIIRFFITAAFLFGVWLIFAFRWDSYAVLSGLAGSFVISGLTYKVFIAEHEASLNSIVPWPLRLIIFFAVLIFSLYTSSFKMLVAVFSGKGSPRIVYFKTRLRSDLARMVLSNSITFTPGTITLDLNDDHLIVHWFFCNTRHAKAAGEAVKGRLERALSRAWR